MIDSFVFNPRDTRYKSPFGAVPCGSGVTFTLRPLSGENFSACELLAYREFSGITDQIVLPSVGECGDLFSGVYTVPDCPELIWYSFRFTRRDGSSVSFGRGGYCADGAVQRWQLTVYDASRLSPDWFRRGVTYQIFPDRFCRLSVPDPSGMIGERLVHENWRDQPVYRPEAGGEITNRDFFGGSLAGIISKLDYLQSLCVTTLYLCPIFEADSNHRYNTADYMAIDPMLGSEADFRTLCAEAHKRGMRVMLDGVFNHTGSNSRYFNARGYYSQLGAAQSPMSPYYSWYTFHRWPEEYDAWWGIQTLPAINEENPDYRRFIITGEDSVIRHWMRCGADAWRLDVADELPDSFIAEIRRVMTEEKPDSFLLGEVWEDGSNKIAYSRRRRYLLGQETDGLMNYPFRTAALSWLGGGDAAEFKETMETLRENYPPAAFYSALNILSTHDTPRVLTLLGAAPGAPIETKDQRAAYRLCPAERIRGVARLRLAALLLYSFPGSPTLFYGDEAGMEGFEDPLNRGAFPWGEEDPSLLRHFRRLGALRAQRDSLQAGDIEYLYASGGGLVFRRQTAQEISLVVLNAGDSPLELTLPWQGTLAADALSGQQFFVRDHLLHLSVPPISGLLLI
ncbi:MAG: alpha-glucosidase C-terminal domain-containing protein [Oscillospiraceae bacterium]|nr:alpha-glucosidase C-terminal domain-containing protein [Oscillospiraceae bacterium]